MDTAGHAGGDPVAGGGHANKCAEQRTPGASESVLPATAGTKAYERKTSGRDRGNGVTNATNGQTGHDENAKENHVEENNNNNGKRDHTGQHVGD